MKHVVSSLILTVFIAATLPGIATAQEAITSGSMQEETGSGVISESVSSEPQSSAPPSENETSTTVYKPKNLTVEQAAGLINFIEGPTLHIQPSPETNNIVLHGLSEAVNSALHVIKIADEQGLANTEKDVQVVVYLVQPTSGEKMPGDNPLPEPVAGVMKLARSFFGYQDYRLLETLVLRTRSGQQVKQEGTVFNGSSYNIDFIPRGTGGGRILIDDFVFGMAVAVTNSDGSVAEYKNVGLRNNLALYERQYAIVGKLDADETTILLVVTAETVD